MKRLLSFYVIASLCSMIAASPSVGASLEHIQHDIKVRLSPAEHLLEGDDTLTLTNRDPTSPVALILAVHAEVLGVAINGQAVDDYSFINGQLKIPSTLGSAPAATIRVHYRVRFDDPLPANTVGIEDPSFGVSATIGAEGAYLSEGTAWFPRSAGKHTYRIRIETPAGMYGVTAGRLLEHGTKDQTSYTLWQTSFPLRGLALSAGHFQIFEGKIDGIQTLAFLTERNRRHAETYLNAISTYLPLYQEILGPYPFEKFAVVENFLPTGYGMPSWTLLGSNVVSLPFIPYTSLPHEIVHSWWGNAVEVDYSQGNWAEGLTTYLADYLLKEHKSADEAVDYRRKILREYASLVSVQNDFPISHFRGRSNKAQQAVGYGKTAMVFHMLRHKVGEEVFWRVLKQLASSSHGVKLGWDDFQQAFSREAAVKLTPFFKQWIEQPGAPQLAFREVVSKETDAGWEIAGVVEQNGALFSLELPLRIDTDEGQGLRSLTIEEQRTTFELLVTSQPVCLTADPGADIFRRLAAEEHPATINDLRASKKLLVISRTDDDPILKASDDLLRGLRQQRAEIIAADDLTATMMDDADLLFIGWPDTFLTEEYRRSGLQADRTYFSWQETVYNNSEDALFLVEKTTTGDRLIALFHPLTAAAARKVARKIPHYGRYSYLTFSDGQNESKGTNEPQTSPLRVDFSIPGEFP